MKVEDAMRQYKPEQVKILFIAEAPGNNSKHFYLANTNLYRAVYTAFTNVFGNFNSPNEFLTFFQSLGCYLDHLSLNPIEKEDTVRRKAERTANIYPLSQRLKSYQPKTLVVLMKAILPDVRDAISLSGISSIITETATPYPAGSEANRQACINSISVLMRSITHN